MKRAITRAISTLQRKSSGKKKSSRYTGEPSSFGYGEGSYSVVETEFHSQIIVQSKDHNLAEFYRKPEQEISEMAKEITSLTEEDRMPQDDTESLDGYIGDDELCIMEEIQLRQRSKRKAAYYNKKETIRTEETEDVGYSTSDEDDQSSEGRNEHGEASVYGCSTDDEVYQEILDEQFRAAKRETREL